MAEQRGTDADPAEAVVLADGALDGDGPARAGALAETGRRLVLVPGTEQLAALPPDLLASCAILRLRPWSSEDVREYLEHHWGERPDPGLVDSLVEATAGHQVHLRHVVPLLAPRRPVDLLAPHLWDGSLVRQTSTLGPDARALLEELSLGFRVLAEPLAPSLGGTREREHLVQELDEHALLGQDGELLPFVRRTVRHGLPAHRLRRMSQDFLESIRDPRPHVDAIAAMVAEGVHSETLARLALELGDEAVPHSPDRALEWYQRAERAGAGPSVLGGRRALAHIRLGDMDAAAHAAELVLDGAGPDSPDIGRAVSAALVAHVERGLVSQARELALWASSTTATTEVDVITLCRAAGDPGRHEVCGRGSEGRAPTLGVRACTTALDGLQDSLGGDAAEAVVELVRAARLLPPDDPGLHPFPIPLLAGWAALHSGDPRTAGSLAQGMGAAVGPFEVKRQLLLGWARLWQGDVDAARRAADDAAALLHPSQTRNRVVLGGLRCGIARRMTDDAATVAAWREVREDLGRVEPDLFMLVALAELHLAAVRVRETSTTQPVVQEALRLLSSGPLRCGPRRSTGRASRPASSPAAPPRSSRTPGLSSRRPAPTPSPPAWRPRAGCGCTCWPVRSMPTRSGRR